MNKTGNEIQHRFLDKRDNGIKDREKYKLTSNATIYYVAQKDKYCAITALQLPLNTMEKEDDSVFDKVKHGYQKQNISPQATKTLHTR